MIKKTLAKRLPAVAMLATIAFALTACSGEGSKEGTSSAKLDEITIMSPTLEAVTPEAGNQIEKKIEEYTGEKISFEWVPNSNYQDRMNIVLASGDLPEVMVVTQKTGSFVTSAESDAFWDLTDYLKDYPNLSQEIAEIKNNSSLNGKVYGIYRKRDIMRSAVMIRKDWLDKLGLEEPKTTEDLYNIAKAFKEKDPNGNGIDDTTGLIIPQWPATINTNSPIDTIATWFGAGNAWITDDKGNLKPSFDSKEYREALKWIKKMYDEGLINQDFATLSADDWNNQFISGKGGIIIDTYSRFYTIQTALKDADQENFGKQITVVGSLESPNGDYALPTDGYAGMLVIPKASVKTEEHLKQVLTFLDKLNDKEMQVLMNNGIEGVNFEVSDGFSSLINQDSNEAKTIVNDVKSYAQVGTNVAGNKYYVAKPATDIELANYKKAQESMKEDTEKAVFNPASPFISPTYTQNGTQLDNIIQDARIQYIAGQIDDKGWEDAVELWKTSGGQNVQNELNELYQKAQQ
ncbi:extracellular solute-binding protein [Streptococcus merionis]|uniref:ABC-type sugar transport system, periplasmic component n=1 Tax=Streptococcus merionis TaxID=400065 RepID=A0A239SMB6_9STRE|nr:extracellular solute-binding protein [Streptococcus merionis]SNU86547.1 ABC-type sugar transport system, periplasmic component [Streptococcus merionis]